VCGVVVFTLLGRGGWPCFVGDEISNTVVVQQGEGLGIFDRVEREETIFQFQFKTGLLV
jgi:hypothetical protein